MDLPDWLQVLHVRGDGETTGEHLARIVRALDGISLHKHGDMLAQLFYANEPDAARAAQVATWKTNCASSARAIYALAGVEADDLEIINPLPNGAAVTLIRSYAARHKAVIPGSQWHMLRAGCGMMYWASGNDAHFEFCLGDVDGAGVADHGGGGRSDNAIDCKRGDVRMSWNRPLQEIYLPELMVTNEATLDDPY
jgi:hypothetical protein